MADKETEFNSYITDALPPAEELEGDVKEVENKDEVETKDLDVKVEDTPNSSGEKEEDGGAVVERITKEVLGETKSESKKDEGADIPDAFTNACLEQGWSEDEIKDFAADLDDADLLNLLSDMEEGDTKQKESESGEVQTKQEVKAKAADKSVSDEPTNEELAVVKKELAEIKAALSESAKVKEAQDAETTVVTVNQAFDEASESFKIFGKTDELLKYPAGPKKGQVVLTSPAMKARQDVWDKAFPFVKGGMDTKAAMEIALTWYKGANLEKDVHRNVIKDLKKHEKKLSAKRVGKRTVKTYESEEERQAEVVREAARKLGIKGKYGL